MQLIRETMPLSQRLKFATFLISYWVIGLALAFWSGLGWLMLLETIQIAMVSIPKLYLIIIRLILGQDIEEKEKLRMTEQGVYKVIPLKLGVRIIISVGLTVLFFWKANIPLIEFIRMLIK